MKSIIVYFSLEGNCDYIAKEIKEKIGSDLLRIKPVKDYPSGNISKFVFGGKSAVFNESPKLKNYTFNKEDYDLIIIGSPVWVGTFAPPINTFLEENDLKGENVAFYLCSSGGGNIKAVNKMAKSANQNIDNVIYAEFVDPKIKTKKENEDSLKEFCVDLLEY